MSGTKSRTGGPAGEPAEVVSTRLQDVVVNRELLTVYGNDLMVGRYIHQEIVHFDVKRVLVRPPASCAVDFMAGFGPPAASAAIRAVVSMSAWRPSVAGGGPMVQP